jgi:soluble lytic murein transglycosylase-like protein
MRSINGQVLRLAAASLLALSVAWSVAGAQRSDERYDEIFRKYTKRYFGVGFDWRHFKAQAMAESELNPKARSRVGARGLMQLMPSTYKLIATQRTEFTSIDDPEFNIAAGILHDRDMWRAWQKRVPDDERHNFMFASYNAGEGTILRASRTAREKKLDHARWPSIESVAPTVPRWRYTETLGYVKKIGRNYEGLKKER